MAVFRSIEEYRKSIRTRMKRMIKRADNNGAKASIYLAGQLKSTAPRKSTRLVQSVRRRKIKSGYSVLAGYSKGAFNVGRWVNQEITARYALDSFNPFFRVGQAIKYGDSAVSPTGKPIEWKATEYPWFDKNADKAIKRYRAGYKKIRAAMRA